MEEGDFELSAFSILYPMMSRIVNMERVRSDVLADIMNSIRTSIENTDETDITLLLDKEAIDKLERTRYDADISNNYVNNECPISLQTFSQGDEIIKLSCGHIFLSEPITMWLTEKKAQCPVCRKQVDGGKNKKRPFSEREIEEMARNWINTRILLEAMSVLSSEESATSQMVDLHDSILQTMRLRYTAEHPD